MQVGREMQRDQGRAPPPVISALTVQEVRSSAECERMGMAMLAVGGAGRSYEIFIQEIGNRMDQGNV